MGVDKRTVSTDALETLGTIIDNSAGRDAIHLAVEPVIAGEKLYAGQHIGLEDGVATTKAKKKLGIVDPFIVDFVPEGEMFWLVVYPRQITSLRHVWTHPDFDEEVSKVNNKKIQSEKWLRDWCASNDAPSYETVIGTLIDSGGYIDDEYIYIHGEDAHATIPDEFWEHAENVTGLKFEDKPESFSCSC